MSFYQLSVCLFVLLEALGRKPSPSPHPNPKRNHFQTPLDEVDAAARILDPILSVVNGGEHVHGKFLKDYRAIEW